MSTIALMAELTNMLIQVDTLEQERYIRTIMMRLMSYGSNSQPSIRAGITDFVPIPIDRRWRVLRLIRELGWESRLRSHLWDESQSYEVDVILTVRRFSHLQDHLGILHVAFIRAMVTETLPRLLYGMKHETRMQGEVVLEILQVLDRIARACQE